MAGTADLPRKLLDRRKEGSAGTRSPSMGVRTIRGLVECKGWYVPWICGFCAMRSKCAKRKK